jgi:hypothetical protein
VQSSVLIRQLFLRKCDILPQQEESRSYSRIVQEVHVHVLPVQVSILAIIKIRLSIEAAGNGRFGKFLNAVYFLGSYCRTYQYSGNTGIRYVL